jgi:molybdopterin molybdotransferase
MPWLQKSLRLIQTPEYAVLQSPVAFKPQMTLFRQVCLTSTADGKLLAEPLQGNGSGDFAHLAACDAFMEFPPEKENFSRGDAFRIWRLK